MDRERLVERLRDRLEWDGWPRFAVFCIVSAAGAVGLLVSFVLLGAGTHSMPLRYGIAGVSGYLAFLLLLGVYVAIHRRSAFEGPDLVDAVNPIDAGGWAADGLAEGTNTVGRFAGGRSGGGGASGSWGTSSGSSSGGSWFDGDLDLGWVLVAAAAALAGIVVVGWVIWAAPVLLAEVLVDAAVVGAVSSRLVNDRRDWTATAVRRTWLPAAVVVAMLVTAGWALQKAVPDAKSIGPAVRALADR